MVDGPDRQAGNLIDGADRMGCEYGRPDRQASDLIDGADRMGQPPAPIDGHDRSIRGCPRCGAIGQHTDQSDSIRPRSTG